MLRKFCLTAINGQLNGSLNLSTQLTRILSISLSGKTLPHINKLIPWFSLHTPPPNNCTSQAVITDNWQDTVSIYCRLYPQNMNNKLVFRVGCIYNYCFRCMEDLGLGWQLVWQVNSKHAANTSYKYGFGPMREFLTLLMNCLRMWRIFDGPEDRKLLTFDSAGNYVIYVFLLRKIISSLHYISPSPSCASNYIKIIKPSCIY